MTVIFWLSLFTLCYVYVGYPLLVSMLARLFGREPQRRDITPTVSLLIPAYNEAAHIEMKIRNSLALDYPTDRLEIVVASDGSTDGTNAVVKRFEAQGVRLLAMADNIGKSAMLSRIVPLLSGEVVVFSDASSELEPDALRRLMANFADPTVGCVSGLYRLKDMQGEARQVTASSEFRVSGSGFERLGEPLPPTLNPQPRTTDCPAVMHGDLRAEGEGLYWRYETFIKAQESRLHSILGAHGAFYGMRRVLFQHLATSVINDDYLIPMRAVAQGYRAVYEPRARAWEREPSSVDGEFARRRRIAAGNCQQMVELRHMLSLRYGWVALCFFSHKVLRTLAPIFMLLTLVTTFWLPSPLWIVFLMLQGLFYFSAWLGYRYQQTGQAIRWLSPPLYFCLGNLAMLDGLLKYCFQRNRLAWGRPQ